MPENHSKKTPRPRLIGRKVIFCLLAVMLGCGGICILVYFWLNYQYIRADWVAARAQGRVEQIYTRTREVVPSDVTLIREEKPHSSTYAWGLSDGAPQYARVQAQQIYMTNTAFSEVLATYKATFEKWGWVTLPLNNDTGLLSIVFRRPSDEKMLVGLCSPVESSQSAEHIQYIAFFDFDETSGCEGTRLSCISTRYCE